MVAPVKAKTRRRDTRVARPGPRGVPIFGVARAVRSDPLGYFVKARRKYGDVVWFRVGLDTIVMLARPEDIKHVLQDNHTNYRKSKFYEPLKPLLGRGIFVSEGDEWVRQRRSATPAFSGHRFDEMARQIVAATERRMQHWPSADDANGDFDVAREMMRVTFEGVASALLGLHMEERRYDAFHDAVTLVFRHAEQSVWTGGLLSHGLLKRINRRYRDAVEEIDRVIYGLIDERVARPRASADLFDMLIDACDPSTRSGRELLRDQLLSFLVAGHETTAVALAWTWHLLAQHPDIEARLHAEIDEVLRFRPPTFADLPKLRYTGMVFEEAMRLYPPVWTISRAAIADDRIGDTDVPAGTTVMISPYVLHRHPEFWPDSERFDPERFSPQAVAQRSRYAYIPFGGGPRNCLGKRFGMMEGQLILAMIAGRYRVVPVAGQTVTPEPAITLRPRHGLRVILRPRC